MPTENGPDTIVTWEEKLRAYNVGVAIFDGTFVDRWKNFVWNPSSADKGAADEMHTQIVSRIATQRLSYQDGDVVSALVSLADLFQAARESATRHLGATHFDAIIWHVLNVHVRPITARWHKEARLGLLDALDASDQFRADLDKLQPILCRLDDFLLEIRDGHAPPHSCPPDSDRVIADEIGGAVEWGIDPIRGEMRPEDAVALNAAERPAIERRRKAYSLDASIPFASGLALSGGGIRSATFSLGVLAALSRRNLLPQFDYLSTVSGGGYLGAFLATFLSGGSGGNEVNLSADGIPFRRTDGESAALRHIRHRSNYLRTSAMERLRFSSAQVYGTLVQSLAIATIPAAFALLEFLIRSLLPGNLGGARFAPTAMLLAVLVLVVMAASRVSGWARIHSDLLLSLPSAAIIVIVGWTALGALHNLIASLAQGAGPFDRVAVAILTASALVPLAATALMGFNGRVAPRLQKVLALVAMLAAPLFLLGVELAAYQWLVGADQLEFEYRLAYLLAMVLVGGAVWLVIDINFTSPRRLYQQKLAEAFLIQPDADEVSKVKAAPSLQLSSLLKSEMAPYPLFNCALNVPASNNPAMRGRRTDFFLFSPAYCGSPLTGYEPTGDWEKADGNLDVGTAMATSGAAVSPLMGLATVAYMRFWLTMLNVRLGYWVRRPNAKICVLNAAPNMTYLLREMFGSIDETKPYLDVTDGGHVENLGVYELLRRRCKFIVAVDGEEDPSMTFHGLANLQRLAAIDLGVDIEIDLDDLRLRETGLSRSHFQICRIRYPRTEAGEQTGFLVYLKLSLTGNEGEFLRRYRLDEPVFPHHPTANQFFTETQFEAYRGLGEHVGEKLFLRAIVGDLGESPTLDQWIKGLATSMLRPR